jgi:asparagine synthetase B (glutamine-hydrolysing)
LSACPAGVEVSIEAAAATQLRSCRTFKGPAIIELSAKDIAHGSLPLAAPDWLVTHREGIEAVGADSMEWEVFVAQFDDRIFFATELDEVMQRVSSHHVAEPSTIGVSQLLGSGFVPLPYTIYENVHRVGAGDRVRATVNNGRVDLSFAHDYPYLSAKSRQDQRPSTAKLLELLVASLERRLEQCGDEGVLLMSSGKDSTAVALALAEMGASLPAVTYRAWPGNVEPEFAAGFCKRLGLAHHTIEMPAEPAVVRRHLVAYFEAAPAPSADHAIIPTVLAAAESGVDAGGILDGGGNDPYMGYLPSQRTRTIHKYRVRGRIPAKAVARLTRFDSKLNYLARSLAASTLPGRNLRNHEIRRIYRDAVDIDDYWYESSRGLKGRNPMDLEAAGLIRQTDGARTNDKVRFVAAARNMTAVLPFLDEELAEYCFHLPTESRYNTQTSTNKVLLRELLAERLDYDEAKVGKGYFAFDGPGFMQQNAAFVREEISSCPLWTPEATTLVEDWLRGIDKRPFVWHALLSLLVVSGWFNRSRFLSRQVRS